MIYLDMRISTYSEDEMERVKLKISKLLQKDSDVYDYEIIDEVEVND